MHRFIPTRLLCRTLALAFATLYLTTHHALAEPDTGDTYFLGIGVCPPWKPQSQDVCRRGVEAVATAMRTHMGLRENHFSLLINEQATSESVQGKLAELAEKLGPEDRLIIYANMHAGSANPAEPTEPQNDVLVFWSKDMPAAVPFALAEGVWMRASSLAGLILQIPVGQLVFVLDACESGAVSPLFIHTHPDKTPDKKAAVLTSASASEMANFSEDRTIALFTRQLASSLRPPNASFADAAKHAMADTRQAAIPICAAINLKRREQGSPDLPCRQVPTLHDPDDLLSQIALQADQ